MLDESSTTWEKNITDEVVDIVSSTDVDEKLYFDSSNNSIRFPYHRLRMTTYAYFELRGNVSILPLPTQNKILYPLFSLVPDLRYYFLTLLFHNHLQLM